MITTSLSLNGLQLSVYLGIYPEELTQKQWVTTDLQIGFPKPPTACFSDRLEDTYCYDKLIDYLKKNIADKHFNMIEHLGQALHQLIKTYFPEGVKVSVKVTKHLPIPTLTQGVSFEYGDGVVEEGVLSNSCLKRLPPQGEGGQRPDGGIQ